MKEGGQLNGPSSLDQSLPTLKFTENTKFFHLAQIGVAALTPCLWVGNDEPNTG